jgi:hypothetical protein
MVSPLFTAFALIAAGRVEVPPPPAQPVPVPQIRAYVRDAMDDEEADRLKPRR